MEAHCDQGGRGRASALGESEAVHDPHCFTDRSSPRLDGDGRGWNRGGDDRSWAEHSDDRGIAFTRTPQQVLQIVYLTPNTGVRSGGFFPNGVNGDLAAT